ncbi:hypothetical protein [Acidicapsa acidisoli]|uniref:hypothetical protein n=1 Tax=Acidicapsa acidisoli TaxID=1615681 RepID=UPI0021E0A3F4|nr:hypothetical protein [Acidicapsa acidisoli]
MNVKLHIDRLVLEGIQLPGSQGAAVKAAVEAELGRLIKANGVSQEFRQGQVVQRVRAGAFQPARNSTPRMLGTQIAKSVYGGIGKSR